MKQFDEMLEQARRNVERLEAIENMFHNFIDDIRHSMDYDIETEIWVIPDVDSYYRTRYDILIEHYKLCCEKYGIEYHYSDITGDDIDY